MCGKLKCAAPGDRESDQALHASVRDHEGIKRPNRPNKPKPKPSHNPEPQTWTCADCGKSYPMVGIIVGTDFYGMARKKALTIDCKCLFSLSGSGGWQPTVSTSHNCP
ncbi:hypothetical protein DESC_190013 [Desulfosarcina cetonica]|nr:hypothetical protein DESC_190013 [Desulfosarcina cetonica]